LSLRGGSAETVLGPDEVRTRGLDPPYNPLSFAANPG